MNARRRNKEGEWGMARSDNPPAASWYDLAPLLDQEVSRLPQKYQVPLILCELEGKSRKDAARLLGLPEGTLSSRLARARELLRRRFRRRGLALSVTALSGLLTQHAKAALPPELVRGTLKAATAFEMGMIANGVVSAKVVHLAQTGLKSLLLQKIAVAVVLCVGLGLAGAMLSAAGTSRFRWREPIAVVAADVGDADDMAADSDEDEDEAEALPAPLCEELPEELPPPARWDPCKRQPRRDPCAPRRLGRFESRR
jgi:hypothetical protein